MGAQSPAHAHHNSGQSLSARRVSTSTLPAPLLNSLKPQGAINPTLQRRKLSRGGNCQGHALGRCWGQDLAPGSVTTGPKLLTTKPCLSDEYRIPLPSPLSPLLSWPSLPPSLPSLPLGYSAPYRRPFCEPAKVPSCWAGARLTTRCMAWAVATGAWVSVLFKLSFRA